MTKENLDKFKKEAYQEGLNDTVTDDVLSSAALSYIESNIIEELTDEEQASIINSYVSGFKDGLSTS